MRLSAFGDSFFWGSDLHDCIDDKLQYSVHTWPALLAKKLNLQYSCFAAPGQGNRQIFNSLVDNIADRGYQDLYIINWTWIDRYDYVDTHVNQWQTIRPSLDNFKIDNFYYKNIHSELLDKQNTLGLIYQAIKLLHDHHCAFIMTAMDTLMMDTQWHCPPSVALLQHEIEPYIHLPENKTFLEWAKNHNFDISNNWHPLEQAHDKYVDYWMPLAIEALNTRAKEDITHAFK